MEEIVPLRWSVYRDPAGPFMVTRADSNWSVYHDPTLLKVGEYRDPRHMLLTRIINIEGDDRILLEITDTGIGIPPENLDKIFDPFFTTKKPDKGTGLGLVISKSIIEECGGKIALQSLPRSGTTISMIFPLGERNC